MDLQVATGKLKSKQKKEKQLENSMRNDSAKEFATMKLKQTMAVGRHPHSHAAVVSITRYECIASAAVGNATHLSKVVVHHLSSVASRWEVHV